MIYINVFVNGVGHFYILNAFFLVYFPEFHFTTIRGKNNLNKSLKL